MSYITRGVTGSRILRVETIERLFRIADFEAIAYCIWLLRISVMFKEWIHPMHVNPSESIGRMSFGCFVEENEEIYDELESCGLAET